jgi:hypothetical protein
VAETREGINQLQLRVLELLLEFDLRGQQVALVITGIMYERRVRLTISAECEVGAGSSSARGTSACSVDCGSR